MKQGRASVSTKDQDSVSFFCSADTDIGFSSFLRNSFFCPIVCLYWMGLAKSTVACPSRNREILVK